MASKRARQDLDWASDLEVLSSALAAGLSLDQSLRLLGQRCSVSWSEVFGLIGQALERGEGFMMSLASSKLAANDLRVDFLVELLSAQNVFGSSGLVEALNRYAQEARSSATASDDVISRVKAIVAVSRLGVASPWVMLALLSVRSENQAAFFTGFGPVILLIGLALCAVATLMIQRGASMPAAPRSLAA